MGGLISHVENVAKIMRYDYGYDVTILTLDNFNEYLAEENINGIKIKRLRYPHFFKLNWVWSYSSVPEIIRFLKNNTFDVVHVHSYTNFGPLAVYLLNSNFVDLQTSKLPFYFTPHYHPDSTTIVRNILRKPYDLLFKKKVFRSFKKVIALTQLEKDQLSMFCDPRIIDIIPNGINLDEIDNASPRLFREEYGLNENERYVLYAGYLLKYKGVQILLDAMTNILISHPDIKLVIVGEGEYKEALKTRAEKHGIAHQVKFTGFVDRSFFVSAVKGCSVFVMPSSYEAFSIVTVEAMASKKPIVATGVGGICELGINSNYLVSYGDVEAIKNLVVKFLNDFRLAQIEGNNNRKAAESYSWNAVASQLEKIYFSEG